jgi:hypothetical protein
MSDTFQSLPNAEISTQESSISTNIQAMKPFVCAQYWQTNNRALTAEFVLAFREIADSEEGRGEAIGFALQEDLHRSVKRVILESWKAKEGERNRKGL